MPDTKNNYQYSINYPFGMRMNGQHTSNTELINKYLYNGKELQDQTNYLDYGFRQMDVQLGRWHVVDAMAESYMSHSPYAYVMNNPINSYDVMGLFTQKDFDYLWNSPHGGTWQDGKGSSLFTSEESAIEWGTSNGNYDPNVYNISSGSGGHWETKNYFKRVKGAGAGFWHNVKMWFIWNLNGKKPGNGVPSVYGRRGDVWVWDSEESTGWNNETDVTQTLPSGLINKIREAFKYKMFYVTSYKEGSNNGTTEETSTYSSQLLKPIDFNTNVKYRGGFWEHNIRYYETKIEIGDNRKKIDAQIWYIPAAYQSANIIYYLYPSKTKGLKSFGKDLKQGWRVYYLTNKNNYKILYIGVSASDFILLENYINTGKF